jgi:hypothetical protein
MIPGQEGCHCERMCTQSFIVEEVDERNGHGNVPCFPLMDHQRPLCLETTSPVLSYGSLSVLAGHQPRAQGGS